MYEDDLNHDSYWSALVKKLGYKEGETIQLINGPEWLVAKLKARLDRHQSRLVESEKSASDRPPSRDGLKIESKTKDCDWVHAFFTKKSDLETFSRSLKALSPKRGFWVSWPKKASKVETDITEQTLRDVLLPTGYVDIKVCAIDEVWSGLKFAKRKS